MSSLSLSSSSSNAITMMDSQEIVEDETLFRDLELENTNTIMDSQQKNEDDNQKADSIHNAVENSYEIINNEGINIRGFDTDSDIEPLTSQDAIICDLSQISDISTSSKLNISNVFKMTPKKSRRKCIYCNTHYSLNTASTN
ncbi:uncharacterized protein LOC135924145 [Gordionus sp. m RMFG-2023]|uniref:uncharacterized protein LOC135924145 n=1 Tax=Gordionus sp. m RMFG-2023 TaxID=3053472 RepID=UPI0031FC6D4C